MNTRPPLENASSTVALSVQFNDDRKMFSVGLNSGFCIFDTETCSLLNTRDFNAGIGIAQMLGSSNILGLVGGGKQPKFARNKLIIWDESKSQTALEISALLPVLSVQLTKSLIVIALQNSVRIYKFTKTPTLLSAFETASNPWGICAVSSRQHVAFLGRTKGHVQLLEKTGNVKIIPAHSSAVRAIQFSPDGDLLATASEMGTLIRVFATSNCARLVELRRGIDPATIFSLAFSPSGTQLACTSDKSTLHIFDVPRPNSSSDNQPTEASVSPTSPGFPPPSGAVAASSSSPSGNTTTSGNGSANDGRGKWGFLSKVPLLPRMFSDVYSFASTPFEAGEDQSAGTGGVIISGNRTLGTGRPAKGMVAWLKEDTLVVVGGGTDARWEKFVVVREAMDGAGTAASQQQGGYGPQEGQQQQQDGVGSGATRRVCVRSGWKKYLGSP
ncbi:SVP1-like protein 2 [Rhypophila decipiens]|uniref:SVP1-like protein 2 n=1 Tax=Rhypophila decipiens TaxID=261697 RepID=A0AAN6YCH7_9PEZI|nr:SVP1-like protein 2 [Rhypophila decipiens]